MLNNGSITVFFEGLRSNIGLFFWYLKDSSFFRKALEVFHTVDGSEIRLTTWDGAKILEIMG